MRPEKARSDFFSAAPARDAVVKRTAHDAEEAHS